MIVLGLDPASVRFGYGMVRAAGMTLEYLEAGVLTAPREWDKYRRFAEIGRDLEALFKENSVDAVAIEAGFVNGQMGALTSGAARGISGYIAAARGIPVFEYAPATVKKSITGFGAAEKSAVAKIVKARLRMAREPSHDAADALAVAITHAMTCVVRGAKAA